MTNAQKEFILKKLIPFIMREQGRGFGMSDWIQRPCDGTAVFDSIERDVPKCGTVACIGGSCQVLTGGRVQGEAGVARVFGLSVNEASGLCYGWHWCKSEFFGWPKDLSLAYDAAKTTIAKARVACRLLRRIAHDGNGKCLHRRPA